jgi:hypothetical protein
VKKNNSIIPKSEDFNQSDINKNTKTSVVDRVRLSNLTSYYKMEVLLQKKKMTRRRFNCDEQWGNGEEFLGKRVLK